MSFRYFFMILACVCTLAPVASFAQEKIPTKDYPGLPPAPPVLDPKVLKDLRGKASPIEQRDRNETFREKKDKMFSATPEEIVELKRRAIENEKVMTYKGPPRKAVSRDITWTLGKEPPVVRMAMGYTTTILFFDAQGKPLPTSPEGSIVGDGDAIDNTTTGNAIVLYVKQPWISSNLTVFLREVPVPINMTLTSELDAATAPSVDYQIRVRVITGGEAKVLDRPDTHNMNALVRIVNGMTPTQGLFSPIPIKAIEQGDPGRLKWTPVHVPLGTFSVGPEGNTYAVFKPGLRLLHPAGSAVLAQQVGADESTGYIISGVSVRVLTATDANGALFRVTLQR